jgi:hypothetical protein
MQQALHIDLVLFRDHAFITVFLMRSNIVGILSYWWTPKAPKAPIPCLYSNPNSIITLALYTYSSSTLSGQVAVDNPTKNSINPLVLQIQRPIQYASHSIPKGHISPCNHSSLAKITIQII